MAGIPSFVSPKTMAAALLLFAGFGVWVEPAEGILGEPICPFGPTMEPSPCWTPPPPPPPPPPPAEVCGHVQERVPAEARDALLRPNCAPNLDCDGRVPPLPLTALDPCRPPLTCPQALQNASAALPPVNGTLCRPPVEQFMEVCSEAAARTEGAVKQEACVPPTCPRLLDALGMDALVSEALCDTLQPPVCEEVGETFETTPMPSNHTTGGTVEPREADCLPDLCGVETLGAGCEGECPYALADCVMDPPGCDNVRSILGGLGQLLLDSECLPRKPMCIEVQELLLSMGLPPLPADYTIDCLPFDPSCPEITGWANGAIAGTVDAPPLGCGLDLPRLCGGDVEVEDLAGLGVDVIVVSDNGAVDPRIADWSMVGCTFQEYQRMFPEAPDFPVSPTPMETQLAALAAEDPSYATDIASGDWVPFFTPIDVPPILLDDCVDECDYVEEAPASGWAQPRLAGNDWFEVVIVFPIDPDPQAPRNKCNEKTMRAALGILADEFNVPFRMRCYLTINPEARWDSTDGGDPSTDVEKTLYKRCDDYVEGKFPLVVDDPNELAFCWVAEGTPNGAASPAWHIAIAAEHASWHHPDHPNNVLAAHEISHQFGGYHYPVADPEDNWKNYACATQHRHWWGWHWHYHKSIMNYCWLRSGHDGFDTRNHDNVHDHMHS